MLLPSRKWSSLLFMLPLFAAACERPAPFKVADRTPRNDVDAPFDPPNTYPGWAFDAPQYTKPTEELTPEPKVKPGDPLHYFTREKIVMIRQPSGYTPEEIPRIAIWSSDNNGFHWQKAGFFGRQQSYFPFEVQEDGDYGIRFVGPNQEQSVHATAYPERVYHVDTALPEVEVTIDPEQSWYNVGQSVTISWRADDYHLIELPVTITSLLDFTADESKPIEIQKGLAKEGSITYQIPPESLNHEMRFRVDALDRANNLGIAYSYALQVVSEPVDNSNAKPTEKDDLKEQVSMLGNAETPKRQNVETSNPPEAVAVIPPPLTPPVEKVVANPTPKKTPPTEEIIEEDASPNSAMPGKLPYATHLARQPERNSQGKTQQDVVAVNPQSADENAGVETSNRRNAETSDFPEVSPSDAGAFTPIQPLDQPTQSQGQTAKPAGEPISMNHPLKTGATATGDCETDLTLLTLRDGAKDDLTHGNGLLIPMPATVEAKHGERQTAMAHPWRMLSQALDRLSPVKGQAVETPIKTVWALPQAEFMQRNPVLRGLFLAGAQMLRPLGEPAQSESHVAGLNSDAENPAPTP